MLYQLSYIGPQNQPPAFSYRLSAKSLRSSDVGIHQQALRLQVRKIADAFSDTDGIPDWWRLAYFGHALGQANDNSRGSDDADGDGVSNLTEFLHGTDPLNPASFPTLPAFNIGPITVAGNNVQLSCTTVTNWTYQLQYRDDRGSASSWINIGPAVSDTGGIILLNDSGGTRTRCSSRR